MADELLSLSLLFLVSAIFLWKGRTIFICLKTARRDIRGVYALTRVKISVFLVKRSNLSVNEAFDKTVKRFRNKICCYFEDEEWTFCMVQKLANQISNYFLQHDYRRHESVGIFMENRPEYASLWIGLSKIGLVPALLNTNLRLLTLEHCLQTVNCRTLIYDPEHAEAVEELLKNGMLKNVRLYVFGSLPKTYAVSTNAVNLKEVLKSSSSLSVKIEPKVGYHDKLFYIYTSGTTGLPKAAIITHSRYFLIAFGSRYLQGVRTSDTVYTPLPLYHSTSTLLGFGNAVLYGTSVAIRRRFSASAFWHDCSRYNATVMLFIGETCRYLLAQPHRPEETNHNLRLMVGNGLRIEVWRKFLERFKINKVSEFYGSTEGNCSLVNTDGTVGAVGFIPIWVRALNFYPVLLVQIDAVTGEPLRDPCTGLLRRAEMGEEGELVGVIKPGISDFQGYTDENAVNEKLVRDVCCKGDVAFRTGDILLLDDHGYYYFKDRRGDTFRWKGENVSTGEVEGIISRSIGADRACVVYGVEIPGIEGKAGMAGIVGSVDLKMLLDDFKRHLPSYARPLLIRILKDLEVTGTFKVKKTELQKEGFDVLAVSDPIYFLNSDGYVLLESGLLNKIKNGEIRL